MEVRHPSLNLTSPEAWQRDYQLHARTNDCWRKVLKF